MPIYKVKVVSSAQEDSITADRVHVTHEGALICETGSGPPTVVAAYAPGQWQSAVKSS